jgi:hypothetical protein
MPDLHGNGIYESYMSELFNPAVGGTPFQPGLYGAGPGVAAGIGGPGLGQLFTQPGTFGQPQMSQPFGAVPVQVAPVIQIVQQIATQQAAQAIQLAHALQALNKIVHGVGGQHHGPFAMQPQTQGWGVQQTPFAQSPFAQSPFTQGVQQQQAIQQLLQYLGVQPYRYGLTV